MINFTGKHKLLDSFTQSSFSPGETMVILEAACYENSFLQLVCVALKPQHPYNYQRSLYT